VSEPALRIWVDDKTLRWLLEEDNPSVRYLTLVNLLGRPSDDREVVSARRAISHMQPVGRILGAQWPEGYWMHPGEGYSPRHKATVWQLIFLAQLGMSCSRPIERAAEYVLSHSRLGGAPVPGTEIADTRFTAGKDSSSAILCLNGNLLRALIWFGYGDDPRVRSTRTALMAQIGQDGLRCRFNARLPSGRRPKHMRDGVPCAWGGIKVLSSLVALPEDERTPPERRVIRECSRFLDDTVRADFPGPGEVSPLWLRFGFPLGFSSDLLELLEVLLLAEGRSAGLHPAISRVLAKRGNEGRWGLEHTPRNSWANYGRRGKSNKWVTLRARRVLKLWGEPPGET
jgi:hypothetical protein